jgi:hypothetical protein
MERTKFEIRPAKPKEKERQAQEVLMEAKQQDEENSKIRDAFLRLAPEYQVYCDYMEEKGQGMSKERKRQFLEFIANLNPKYLDFLNVVMEKQIEAAYSMASEKETGRELKIEDLKKIAEEYEERLEFFENNFTLPLSDQEAVSALVVLQGDKKEVAEAKINAWRKLAKDFGYTDGKESDSSKDSIEKPLVYLARAGFNLLDKAPNVRDERSGEDKGLCCEIWGHDWGNRNRISDESTQDEIRFFVPRLIPGSIGQNFREYGFIERIFDQIKKEHKEIKNADISMGEGNQIVNQILAHYNQTGESIPLNRYWALTKSLPVIFPNHFYFFYVGFGKDSRQKGLFAFEEWSGDIYEDAGLFPLGVEKLKK